MVLNLIFMFLFFLLIIIFLSIVLFISLYSINNIFLKYPLKKIIKISVVFNLIFISLYFLFNLIGNSFFMSLIRLLNYYFGFLLYGFLIGLIYVILFYFLKNRNLLFNKKIGNIIIFIFLLINFIAIYNFENGIQVKEFTLYSNKINQSYSFIQIADTQYGSVSKKHMIKTFDLALNFDIDFIVFVGDLIDTTNYKINDFNFLNEINKPIYFVRGNHEFYHKPNILLNIFNNISSIELLLNEKVIFNEIEIIGIDYSNKRNNLKDNLNKIGINNSKYSILLYHEPKEIDYAINNEIDLILLGHTHAGQIFPINFVVDLIYKYSRGYYEVNNSVIYTTSGAGLFGPKMRLGSTNEIVLFHLIPNK
jgi:uncharacterized protein